VLLEGEGGDLGGDWFRKVYPDTGDFEPLAPETESNHRFLSAKLDRSEGDIYVTVYVTHPMGLELPLVHQDVVEVTEMEKDMISVDL